MARHQHQQNVVRRAFGEGAQQRCFLAFTRTRRKQHRTRAPGRPPRRSAFELGGRRRDVELEIARDRDFARAQLLQACRIGFALRRDDADAREARTRQCRQPRVTARRTFGQPRVRQHQRHAQLVCRADQVRPQLGFHEDADRRSGTAQKTPYQTGVVIRQVDDAREAAVKRFGRLPPGRRHAGEQNRPAGMRRAQGFDQRLRRAHLTDGNGVNPDCAGRHIRRAEALAPAFEIAAFAPSTPQQPQGNQRRSEQQNQSVERPVQNQARGRHRRIVSGAMLNSPPVLETKP